LAKEIRIRRSLTYHIESEFDARQGQGPFLIETSTRMEKIHEIVAETINVLREFHDKGVTDEEVDAAKSFLKGKFPRSMETPERFTDMLLTLRYYGISDDYLRNYLDNLDAISAREVNRVIAKFFNPDQLRIQVYAPREAALKQLQSVAPTEEKSFQDFL
jgi:zinc protease